MSRSEEPHGAGLYLLHHYNVDSFDHQRRQRYALLGSLWFWFESIAEALK
jgi:hypothetical protein